MTRMNQLSSYKTTVAAGEDGLTRVTYHRTAIVTWGEGVLRLATGGWDSVTTRRKMNQASQQFRLGFSVYRDRGESYVRWPDGAVEPLIDKMEFQA